MPITILASPTAWRRGPFIAVCDSVGRLWVYGEQFSSANVQDYTNRHPERYDPATTSWSTLAASPWYQYTSAWMMDSTDRIIMAGGIILDPATGLRITHENHGAIYDPSADVWTSIADLPGDGPNAHWWDSGGHLWAAGLPTTMTAWYSGGPSGTWTTVASAPADLTSTVQMFPKEPIAANGLAYIPESYWYDMGADIWTAFTATGGPSGVARTCQLSTDGRYIYHFAAEVAAPWTATKRYDTVTNTWATMAPSPTSVRAAATVANGQYIYCIGGFVSFGVGLTTILQYDTVADSWSDTGDLLSQARTPMIAKDTVGPGYYLVEGPGPQSPAATRVVEYWTLPFFVGPPAKRRGRTYGAIVGD